MAGGSRVTKTETSPWGMLPVEAGEEFEFLDNKYISTPEFGAQGIGQLPRLIEAFDETRDLYEGGEFSPSYFPNQTYAPFDPYQQIAQQAIVDYSSSPNVEGLQQQALGGVSSGLNYGTGLMGYGTGLLGSLSPDQYSALTPFTGQQYSDLLSGSVDTGRFDAISDAYRKQAEKQLTDPSKGLLSNIRSGLVQYGQTGGSSRGDILQAQAIKEANERMSDNIAKAMFNAQATAEANRVQAAQLGMGAQQYGIGLGDTGARTMQGFLGQYPTVMEAPLSMYGQVGNVGAQQRAMTQAGIDEKMAKHQYEQTLPQTALQNYLSMLSGEWGGQSVATNPGNSPIGSILGAIAGGTLGGPMGAMAGSTIGGSLFN
jgi:hypothetical protein|tara:strand:+ start:1980 stop:3092 length:1113 start_codon:yes stop_codon:yes gene_type:complete